MKGANTEYRKTINREGRQTYQPPRILDNQRVALSFPKVIVKKKKGGVGVGRTSLVKPFSLDENTHHYFKREKCP